MKQLQLPLKRKPKCHPDRKYHAKDLCRTCYLHEYKAEWWEENKARVNAQHRERWHSYLKYSPEEKEKRRQYRLRTKEKMKTYQQAIYFQKTYGITVAERDEMLAKHEGKCWLCGERTAEMIDHCHTTGKIRGALCVPCNAGLGQFRDDTGLLLKAIRYLNNGKEG